MTLLKGTGGREGRGGKGRCLEGAEEEVLLLVEVGGAAEA